MFYKVQWGIEIEADSPQDAARQALAIQRDPASIATVFTVTTPGGEEIDVDLLREGVRNE